jgi:hypothetical protein
VLAWVDPGRADFWVTHMPTYILLYIHELVQWPNYNSLVNYIQMSDLWFLFVSVLFIKELKVIQMKSEKVGAHYCKNHFAKVLISELTF